MIEYDVIILGSGISGMSSAIYLKRSFKSCLIIENNTPGGQMNKASVIENYPGYKDVTGPDLAMNIYQQVIDNGVEFEYGDVSEIDYDKKIIRIDDKEFHYKYLVIATGRRDRMLGLPLEDEYIGKGISFCATCDGNLYQDKDVVVVGGGSSAVSEAIYLSSLCKKVYLVYRRDELRAEEILKNRLEDRKNIEIIRNSNISAYQVSDKKIVGVKLDNGREIEASCVFLAIGHVPNSELFDGEKKDGYIVTYKNGRTSKKDVYACGDVIYKDLYQLVTASSEGVMVASDIIHRINVGD